MTPSASKIIARLADATRSGNAEMRRYTLHSHTEFCDGRAQMEVFARMARERGFAVYGFTPHSPVPIVSTCNMLRDNVARYDAEFARISVQPASATTFLRGMEIDYLGRDWGPSSTYFDDLQLDYSIGSVHFIPTPDGELVDIDGRFENFAKKMSKYFRGDIRYVVETFYNQSMAMVDAGGFDIIGHYDKVGHNASHFREGIEEEEWYVDLRDRLTDMIVAKECIVEINTKALADHRRFFPSVAMWRRLMDAGVPIVVNSDAHVPALINAGRDEAFAIIDSLLTH